GRAGHDLRPRLLPVTDGAWRAGRQFHRCGRGSSAARNLAQMIRQEMDARAPMERFQRGRDVNDGLDRLEPRSAIPAAIQSSRQFQILRKSRILNEEQMTVTSRREFLVACGGACFAVVSSFDPCRAAERTFVERTGLPLGVQLYTLGEEL